MDRSERAFFLATIESMETTITAQIKALRAVIAMSQNESRPVVTKITPNDTLESLDEIEERMRSLLERGDDE